MGVNLSEEERKRLSNQLIRLGDMMGDGLHHEEPWISAEYKKITRLLYPEEFKKMRELKNAAINEYMTAYIKDKACPKCKAHISLKQTRSGSKTVKCIACGSKFTLKTKKRRKS